ncbi:hypothetical protein [Clostridium sp. YIM B02555]|uniref:hypothetical protein n=1 Tax=Clostridium sp. YIM B02555 TaxID=2911968 RepID=UPI001EED9034|nr:hypothetical protein [Clostridium sp. YIM B02555]
MNKRNDMIIEWAIKKIETDFKDDVSLLLFYGSYENGTDNPLSDVDFYFIPKTERAYKLTKTFIVEGVGFDLFPMSWERIEGIAEVNEVLLPCIANVKILYCNSDADKTRFKELQNKLKKNLSNKVFMLDKASKKMGRVEDLYKTMIFEDNMCELRTIAGHIILSLADIVAYSNQTYFSRGVKKQIEDLKNMEVTPKDFILLYESVIKADLEFQLKKYCYKIIKNTQEFLDSKTEKANKEENKANYEALAELYQEIISTWNKIYICCDSGDINLAYISGTSLQRTLNEAARENGLNKFDLMSYYDSRHLNQFKERAMEIQKTFVKTIEENGVVIESYDKIEEFIERN